MKLKFEVTIEEAHEHEDLTPYTNALQRDAFLFHLFYNFSKEFKHRETDPTFEEVMNRIFELKHDYKVIIN